MTQEQVPSLYVSGQLVGQLIGVDDLARLGTFRAEAGENRSVDSRQDGRLQLLTVFASGGSSIEADKALPHPQSPRSNTLQYFYLQYSKMRCIVKENNIF